MAECSRGPADVRWPVGAGSDLVELVLFAELHALLPAVVTLEQVGCDPPELDQLVLFQALGQRDVVKVVISVDGSAQRLHRGKQTPMQQPLHSRSALHARTTRAVYLTA